MTESEAVAPSQREESDGGLEFVQTVDTPNPSFLALARRNSLGSNYGTGNFPIYPILAAGSIGAATDNFQDDGNGTGPNPARQEGPHAHMILADPSQAHVFGVDLGLDRRHETRGASQVL